jgi:hypothetical protein
VRVLAEKYFDTLLELKDRIQVTDAGGGFLISMKGSNGPVI